MKFLQPIDCCSAVLLLTPLLPTARIPTAGAPTARIPTAGTPAAWIPTAGSLHAPVRVGMEDARAGAKPRLSHRDLRRRSRDLVPERQSRRGVAGTAQDYEQAEAHGQRGEDTNLQGPGRRVRLSGLHVRANVF